MGVFEAFRAAAEGEGEGAIEALLGYLAERTRSDLFDGEVIGEFTGLSSTEVERLLVIAIDEKVGLLQRETLQTCPACGERDTERHLELEASRGNSACPECGEEFGSVDEWLRDSERLALTEEAAAEIRASAEARAAKPRKRAVIVCALPLERDAVLKHLDELETRIERGTVYLEAELEGEHLVWEIAVVTLLQAGNAPAASETTKAIAAHQAEVALFVGIAGGWPGEVELGEVVAATKVANIHSGKDTDQGFKPRLSESKAAHPLKQWAGEVIRRGDWPDRIKGDRQATEHRATLADLASGEQLMRSTKSASYLQLREIYDRTVGVEMEGFGFHTAVEQDFGVMAMVIRGISDLLENKKEEELAGWQPRAADHAAAFAIELLVTSQPS